MEPEGDDLNPVRRDRFIPLVWIGAVFAVLILSAILATTWMQDTGLGTGTPEELVEWNIVGPDKRVIVWADLSAPRDLREGCLITLDEALRWEDRQVVARVQLRDAPVVLEQTKVTIGDVVVCDFVDPDAARAFATEAERTGGVPQG